MYHSPRPEIYTLRDYDCTALPVRIMLAIVIEKQHWAHMAKLAVMTHDDHLWRNVEYGTIRHSHRKKTISKPLVHFIDEI
jgi:hypothetical protein